MIPIAKPMLGNEEINAVRAVLESGALAQGKQVQAFEEEFSRYIGSKHGIATSSGTSALQVALQAHGIDGGEVITTPFTFIATANAILYAGARPVFADIGEDFNIDIEKVKEKLTNKTKAILPVHLFGKPADMNAIMDIAADKRLVVIEDACQAHGAAIGGKKVGSFSTSCFSFYATKNMTCGEGGMIVTDDADVMRKARMLREYGSSEKYKHKVLSYNYRMTDVEAAIGREQLKKLERFNAQRNENAQFFQKRLEALGINVPRTEKGITHVYHQYTLCVKDRDIVLEALRNKQIGASVFYPLPIYHQEFYQHLGYMDVCRRTEESCRQVVSIPVHPAVTKEERQFIVETLSETL